MMDAAADIIARQHLSRTGDATISYLMVATALPEMIGHYQTTQGAWVLSAFLLSGA
jgi:hypothetical protein